MKKIQRRQIAAVAMAIAGLSSNRSHPIQKAWKIGRAHV